MPKRDYYGKFKNMTLADVKSAMRSSRSLKRYRKQKVYRGLNRRGVASAETGYVDTAIATYNCDTTGSIALIPTIAQGASVNQRVGKKVMLKNLQIRGQVQAGTAGTIADYAVIIVYDRRPTGSLPAVTDILVTANSNSFNNDANSGRFKIIRRWDGVVLSASGAPTNSLAAVDFSQFIKLKGLPMVFKAAGTGAIGDIEEGALYILTVGSQAAGTAAASAPLAFRTRFVDV